MNESDWLSSTDPQAMLRYLTNYGANGASVADLGVRLISDRKLRLFACACCRAVWDLLADPHNRRAVEVAERYADGEATGEELAAIRSLTPWRCVIVLLSDAAGAAAWAASHSKCPPAAQAALLRDLFGNPWRCRAWTDIHDCSPSGHELQFLDKRWLAWNGGTVPRIARRIYESRDFSPMPIIADALEEAGCTNEDVLRHCRGQELVGPDWYVCEKCGAPTFDPLPERKCGACGPEFVRKARRRTPLRGPHVRGCWVMDLILGKE